MSVVFLLAGLWAGIKPLSDYEGSAGRLRRTLGDASVLMPGEIMLRNVFGCVSDRSTEAMRQQKYAFLLFSIICHCVVIFMPSMGIKCWLLLLSVRPCIRRKCVVPQNFSLLPFLYFSFVGGIRFKANRKYTFFCVYYVRLSSANHNPNALD